MKILAATHAGKVTAKSGDVKAYRNAPYVLVLAIAAAHHYARRDDRSMVVIAGNSYGQALYRIAPVTEDLQKYNPGASTVGAYLVSADGAVENVEVQ